METPKTKAGELTERIMYRAQENIEHAKAGKLTTSQYNRIYEAVIETLEEAQP